MAKRSGLHPLSAILTKLLRSHGMTARMLEHRLQQRWPEIVGEQVGRHSYPDSIRHRRLHLVAENSVWLQQLLFLKPELLAKINAASDGEALTEIVLRVGPIPPPAALAPPAPQANAACLTGETRTAIEAAVQAAADPNLQARLRTLFSKSAF